ncbi:MAG: hypothetical protein N2316_04185 [Spirochaetes bacterium]|nr:hypothetical protein [Spirochaetota bacterium]
MMRQRILACALFAMLIGLRCAKLEGDFGFKAPFDDHYRKVSKVVEIKSDEKREWVFVFKNVTESFDAGVFIMKKEIVWAEVMHNRQRVSKEQNVVYGTIEDLPEGKYKIVITDGKNVIAEKEFLIYSDEDIQ